MNVRLLRKCLKKAVFGNEKPNRLSGKALEYYNLFQPKDIYYYKNPKTEELIYYYWSGINSTIPILIGGLNDINYEFEYLMNEYLQGYNSMIISAAAVAERRKAASCRQDPSQ